VRGSLPVHGWYRTGQQMEGGGVCVPRAYLPALLAVARAVAGSAPSANRGTSGVGNRLSSRSPRPARMPLLPTDAPSPPPSSTSTSTSALVSDAVPASLSSVSVSKRNVTC